MCSWNVTDISKMVLPPCHILVQFYVCNGELSCLMYQRSGDMGFGVPYNIASYALLTRMIAHVTGLQPGEFIHSIGDAHIYLTHVSQLKEQIERKPRAFPKLFIKNKITDIDEFCIDDFDLVGYDPYPNIKMDIAM